MAKLKTIVVPPAEELTQRLTEIADEPSLIKAFYPLLTQMAGRPLAGEGIVVGLVLAVHTYVQAEGLPPVVTNVMLTSLHQYLDAFTDDPDILKAAREHLKESGLPTG